MALIQLPHGAGAQHMGHAAPGQGDADIRQPERAGAETPLVIAIADAEIEVPHALPVQGRHRPFDAELTGRAVRPLPAGVGVAQQRILRAVPQSQGGGHDLVAADQRRNNGVAVSETAADDVAVELRVTGFVEDELLCQLVHAPISARINYVANPYRSVNGGAHFDSRSEMAGEDAPAARQLDL